VGGVPFCRALHFVNKRYIRLEMQAAGQCGF
jgi:hypothetical protein